MPQLINKRHVGRPSLPSGSKKARVSVSLSQQTLATIDQTRGYVSRSEFLQSIVENNATQIDMSRSVIRKNGTVYTPKDFADFVASKVFQYFWDDVRNQNPFCLTTNDNLRVLDPACGNGELLIAIWDKIKLKIKKDDVQVDPRKILCGIDIEQSAIEKSRLRINSIARSVGFKKRTSLKFRQTNGLFPFNANSSKKGWQRIQQEFDAEDGFDIVIANPPWGADVTAYRDKLSQDEFCLYQGQFDTSDLFLERALSICKHDGYIAFIIPDSLFAQERENLRKLLLDRTQIKFLGRFGEKIFPSINRACAVIICKCSSPYPEARTDCLRLTPESRKRIFSNCSTFTQECAQLQRGVMQSRFISNPTYRFDIDVEEKEEMVLRVFNRQVTTFGDYLTSARGVELSKYGHVCFCNACKQWLPFPTSESPKCSHCKTPLIVAEKQITSIVYDTPSNDLQPFLVGESISRYILRHALWISTKYEGINYKSYSTYRLPKIVVRKTGVGVSAAIDYSGAYTNQVVYLFRQKAEAECFPLEFFLGVLNSRCIYYFVTKQHGETEWRSHPYLTQKQILSLPLPSIDILKSNRAFVNKITELLRPYTTLYKEPSIEVDAKVERMVAQLYGLTSEHYERIYSTLESVQELLPIRILKRVKKTSIFSE